MTVSELRDWLEDAELDQDVFIRDQDSNQYYQVSFLVTEREPGASPDFVIELERADED